MIIVGDIGTTISIDVGIDLASASETTIKFVKPSREEGQWTGIASGTTVTYTVVDGDIDEAGRWYLQVFVELPTWSGSSVPILMTVGEKIA